VLVLALVLGLPHLAQAEKATGDFEYSPLENSILLPLPRDIGVYDKDISSLNHKQQWRVKIHGLRMAPLHPGVWGVRKIDRTENRQLIPIRPFFLRISEDPNFIAEKITLWFMFERAKKKHIVKLPERKAPVLDIGFSGEYEKGLPGGRALRDRGYTARLTGYPRLASGIYYRSHTKFKLQAKGSFPLLETGREYKMELRLMEQMTVVILDEKPFAAIEGRHKNGLISLTTSWLPITISHLEVKGIIRKKGKEIPVTQSGLVMTG